MAQPEFSPPAFDEPDIEFDPRYKADTLDMTDTLRFYLGEGLVLANDGKFEESDQQFRLAQRYLTGDSQQLAMFYFERAKVYSAREYITYALEDLGLALGFLIDIEDEELKAHIMDLMEQLGKALEENARSWVLPDYPEYIRAEYITGVNGRTPTVQ